MLAKKILSGNYFPRRPTTSVTTNTLAPREVDNQIVKEHTQWLLEETQRNALTNRQEEIDKYNAEARQTVTVGKREIRTFVPFRSKSSALKTITRKQVLVLGITGLASIAGLVFFGLNAVVIAIAIVSVLYLGDLLLNFLLSLGTLDLSTEIDIEDNIVFALANADWPRYTILCPLYHEIEIVPQFVQAMQALDYPKDKLQILFLTEEDDAATRELLVEMGLPLHFEIITVPDGQPRTKPRACNYGLLQATGDYIVIYDAEDVPEPLQLKKAVLAFARLGEKTACVQAKLNFYNAEQNLLTRWFTAEYSLWFDLTLPGLQKLGVPLPLGGTSNHFRTHLLRLLGAWDAFNVTEDCDLGLRQASYGFKTAILNSTTYEEANSQVKNWIRQRSRWIKGYMQTYLVYMREPQVYLRRSRLLEFLSLQVFVGGKTAVLFVNPFMWLLLGIYILFYGGVVGLYHALFPTPVLYMGVMCLIFGNFFYTYTHLIGCMKRGYFHLLRSTLLIPIYWAMASIAAFIALQQLILKPHYWEKTEHGLHLRAAGPLPKITVVAEVSEPNERSSNEDWDTHLLEKTDKLKAISGPIPIVKAESTDQPPAGDDSELVLPKPTIKLKKISELTSIIEAESKDQPLAIADSVIEESTENTKTSATNSTEES